ncbi:hypothetical protein CPB83DRAFT_905788 [Crepidotus variabilis]|uniref:Uncharacterized protein n=1 Tax=Crepidotus variabilis TaxID=179855 RepID=A0A9P6EJ81_9AGAR|nr:hypothetical protein CPB83DRAFT_905788 [Crepidotus variabilis]
MCKPSDEIRGYIFNIAANWPKSKYADLPRFLVERFNISFVCQNWRIVSVGTSMIRSFITSDHPQNCTRALLELSKMLTLICHASSSCDDRASQSSATVFVKEALQGNLSESRRHRIQELKLDSSAREAQAFWDTLPPYAPYLRLILRNAQLSTLEHLPTFDKLINTLQRMPDLVSLDLDEHLPINGTIDGLRNVLNYLRVPIETKLDLCYQGYADTPARTEALLSNLNARSYRLWEDGFLCNAWERPLERDISGPGSSLMIEWSFPIDVLLKTLPSLQALSHFSTLVLDRIENIGPNALAQQCFGNVLSLEMLVLEERRPSALSPFQDPQDQQLAEG